MRPFGCQTKARGAVKTPSLKNPSGLRWLLIGLLLASLHASAAAAEVTFLNRPQDGTFDLRVMNWNVGRSSILPAGVRQESFERIIKAIRPDVVCLQEINPARAGELSGIMDRLLPLPDELRWQIHFATDLNSVVISRYPLLQRTHERLLVDPENKLYRGHVMCLVDLPTARNAPDVYVIATHFQSRADDANIRARQLHADALVRLLRDRRRPGHQASLSAGTAILLVGDLNVYQSEPKDIAHHLTTLLTGNNVDETTVGPDIKPDWDGSNLLEVKPRHNGREKEWYTWRYDSQVFPPDALDRIIYTDSVMAVRSSFVLNTTTMKEDELAGSGLLATDVLMEAKPGVFDHLPMVANFAFGPSGAMNPKPLQPNAPATGTQSIR